MATFTFIDLFAGLGGFHFALNQLGGKCVFASEIKSDLRKLYEINFPNTPIEGDITSITIDNLPPHDILCAGFPCQPFSQAGKRQGFNDDKDRGNLFDYICDIVKARHPRYIVLENVSNLKGHDEGRTWATIRQKLQALNYEVADPVILSPHQFGVPQHRRRIYIVCENREYGRLNGFTFPKPDNEICDIHSIIDETDKDYIPLKMETRKQLEVWQEFLYNTKKYNGTIPGFPIWAMEFGADYPIEKAPAYLSAEELRGRKGKLGKTIVGLDLDNCLEQLPVYAQTNKNEIFPKWKINYIMQNREFYKKNKFWLDKWLKKVEDFDNSHLKLEWNCGENANPIIEDKIVQFRASGIRVKLPNYSPALNLVGTQIPIFPWVKLPDTISGNKKNQKGRYMTIREAAKLQGMDNISFGNDTFRLPQSRCFEALGNAVNVQVVCKIVSNLLHHE